VHQGPSGRDGLVRMSISVVIPNWNGESLLPSCLASLQSQTLKDFETIIVDDCSIDRSLDLLETGYPWVKVIRMPRNSGFAAAANAGIRAASGEVVVLVNNDVELEPSFLEVTAATLDANPQYSFMSAKILIMPDRRTIHSAGDFYRRNGVPGNRGVWTPDIGQYDRPEPVFGPCAAAAAYRRTMLDDVAEDGQVFDESLFMYFEDVDLNFRAQLRGHRCLYQPEAVAYHRLSASASGPLSSFYCGRNLLLVLLKDMPPDLLRRSYLDILWAQCGFTAESIRHFREPAARARLRGQLASLWQMPSFLAMRRHIRRRQMVTSSYISSILE
jgi:GT2 family glycosyltransferase